MGHDDLVAVDHALVAMVLRVGGGLMGAVGGMGVVLGLVSGWGHSHGEARAGVTLALIGMGCMGKKKKRLEASDIKQNIVI